ncbi:nitroreductase family protein [Sanyastnella coralliicola]|uniref:nitroreductase family protein n=1 Tax=Sanyastnella coralliicola TaxID=3069118 RepID=UPI0027B8EDAA|nr:nitroreductase family protein [Longitalea sp. SCSIO 12813]
MAESSTFIPYPGVQFEEEEMIRRSREYYEFMNKRRSVRTFSDRPVPKEVIENILRTAGTAPSGAHKEPWTFCVVQDGELRKEVRRLAEEEEYRNYNGRMSDRWLKDLEPFGTDHIKPFIEVAPALIVVFKHSYTTDEAGKRANNYYVNESVGIAVGMMLAAVHNAGLVALTHTPSPMNFLEKALDRPPNEKAYLNIPIGYPAEGTEVPELTRKGPDKLIKWY